MIINFSEEFYKMPHSNKDNELLSSFGEIDGNFNLINYTDLIQKRGKYF